MDTIETIILTSIVNIIITGLVGGIVVYTVQRKIDATIQKSLFEHQTKFSRSYEKRVEVLETLYQKFRLFRDAVKETIVEFFRSSPRTDEIDEEKLYEYDQDMRSKLDDFWRYFDANRLYLPHRICVVIKNIHDDARGLPTLIALLLFSFAKNEPRSTNLPDRLADMMKMKAGSLDSRPPEFLITFVSLIVDERHRWLEYIYQAVAEFEH